MDKLSLAFRYNELIDQGHVKNQGALSRLPGVSDKNISVIISIITRLTGI